MEAEVQLLLAVGDTGRRHACKRQERKIIWKNPPNETVMVSELSSTYSKKQLAVIVNDKLRGSPRALPVPAVSCSIQLPVYSANISQPSVFTRGRVGSVAHTQSAHRGSHCPPGFPGLPVPLPVGPFGPALSRKEECRRQGGTSKGADLRTETSKANEERVCVGLLFSSTRENVGWNKRPLCLAMYKTEEASGG